MLEEFKDSHVNEPQLEPCITGPGFEPGTDSKWMCEVATRQGSSLMGKRELLLRRMTNEIWLDHSLLSHLKHSCNRITNLNIKKSAKIF
jgi:hypothetical protein